MFLGQRTAKKILKLIIVMGAFITVSGCDGLPNEDDKSDSSSEDSSKNSGATSDGNSTDGKEKTCLLEGCDSKEKYECVIPNEMAASQAPETIQQAVDLINALPKPLTIYCFLEALQRPLFVNATSNDFSAQGATSINSPRIFIKYKKLIISFVPEREGSQNIELAEETTVGNTIKGDLHFPIEEAKLAEVAPYQSIFKAGEPSCANLCHSGYEALKTFENGTVKYSSEQIFPKASKDVTVEEMKEWRDQCDPYISPLCDFYRSMFDSGEVKSFIYAAPQ
jgi:hypothetical protein